MDLVIKNCKLVDKIGEYNIKVENGKICDISKNPIDGDETIDINHNYIMPGFIDPHIHFRDPGLTQKEDFKTGSLAAANGGFTTVIDMPNTLPKTNTYKALEEKIKLLRKNPLLILNFRQGTIPLKKWKK